MLWGFLQMLSLINVFLVIWSNSCNILFILWRIFSFQKSQTVGESIKAFCSQIFFEIFKIHRLVCTDIPMNFWLLLMCFINVLCNVIANLKFYNCCFIKDDLQRSLSLHSAYCQLILHPAPLSSINIFRRCRICKLFCFFLHIFSCALICMKNVKSSSMHCLWEDFKCKHS